MKHMQPVGAEHAVTEHTPDTTLRPGVLGRELTSLTSVSSDVLPSPEQLSSSWSLSSCFKSGASTKGRQGRVERESTITQCHAPQTFTSRRKGWVDLVYQVLRQLNHFSKSFLISFGTEGKTLHRQQCSVCTGMLRSVYCFNCCIS